MTPANLPKSLHTVTVLVAIARRWTDWSLVPARDMEAFVGLAVADSLRILGYADTPDTYGLAAKARAILAVRA